MPQSIIVHNLEDAQTYLLLGFTVVMSMRLLKQVTHTLGTPLQGCIIHAENNYGGGAVPMMTVWISSKAKA